MNHMNLVRRGLTFAGARRVILIVLGTMLVLVA